jgi:hypothetical protein
MMTNEELQEALNWRKTDKLIEGMLSHIDEQAGQIATLKAALISERNRYLVDFIHEYDDVRDCKEEAKEQLTQEYPDIFKEE